MKTTVIALLAATAEAQPADGTAVIDCGNCDEAAYDFWGGTIYTSGGSWCYTDAGCSGEDRCGVVTIGGHGEAQRDAYCMNEEYCDAEEHEDEEIEDSTLSYSVFCNDAETE